MMIDDEHTEPAVYTLGTDKEWRFVALIGVCFLSFLLAVVLLFVIAALDVLGVAGSGVLGIGLIAGAPLGTYFLLRKKMRRQVTVILSPSGIEIQKGKGKVILSKESIKSYDAYFQDGETFDTENVIVRPSKGRIIKLQASTSSGSLKEMRTFRKDFERWAEANELVRWQPWYRRK